VPCGAVESQQPRLLVALAPRPELDHAFADLLPDVPWAYLERGPDHRGVEALLVGSFARGFPEFDPSTTPALRFVQRIFTGLDGLPFARFPEHVAVAGNVGAFAPFVSEHAVTLALATARDLRAAHEMVRTGRLRPPPDQRLLYESTVLILGYGEIGRAIGARVRAFGAHVNALNRDGAPADGAERVFPADLLHQALAEADFVFEARPLTSHTVGSLGAPEFAVMRPKAVLVNIGRAGTIDEAALYRHLQGHPDFRAAIDVWWSEDYAKDTLSSRFPFADLPNFVGTPHCAGYAPQAEVRAARMAIENVARFFRDGRPAYTVDRSEYQDQRENSTPTGTPAAPGGTGGTSAVLRR